MLKKQVVSVILFLTSVGLLFGGQGVIQMPTKGRVTASALNVREGPGTNFTIVGVIHEGTMVDIIGVSGNWYKVNVDQFSGKFVYSGYIEVTETSEVSDDQAAKNPYPTLSHTDPKKPGTTNIDTSLSPTSDF